VGITAPTTDPTTDPTTATVGTPDPTDRESLSVTPTVTPTVVRAPLTPLGVLCVLVIHGAMREHPPSTATIPPHAPPAQTRVGAQAGSWAGCQVRYWVMGDTRHEAKRGGAYALAESSWVQCRPWLSFLPCAAGGVGGRGSWGHMGGGFVFFPPIP
jgi:hypothetical protein